MLPLPPVPSPLSPLAHFVLSSPLAATPVMAAITAVTALNSTAIQVSWLYSGVVARLNAYLVQVRVFGSGVWTNGSTVSPNVITTVTVGSLLPFTLYEVQVVLLLNGGISVGSKVSAVMTLQAPPGEAPSSVVTTPIGATEIELTWVVSIVMHYTTHTSPIICMWYMYICYANANYCTPSLFFPVP